MKDRFSRVAVRLPSRLHALTIVVGLLGIGWQSAYGQSSLRLVTVPEPSAAAPKEDLAAAYFPAHRPLIVGAGDAGALPEAGSETSGRDLADILGGVVETRPAISFGAARHFHEVAVDVQSLQRASVGAADFSDSDVYSYRVVAVSEPHRAAQDFGGQTADLYKLLFVASRNEERPDEAQPSVRTAAEPVPAREPRPASSLPTAADTSIATVPQPLNLDHYPAPAAIRLETARPQSIEPTVVAETPASGGAAPDARAAKVAGKPAPESRRPQATTIRSEMATIPKPAEKQLAAGNIGPVSAPSTHVKTIALATRRQQPAETVPVPSVQSSSREYLVTQPEAIPGPTAQQERYLGDAMSAGARPCHEGNCLPHGCPYEMGQSGSPYICGVDCGPHGAPCCETWANSRLIPWSLFGPGEYVGPPRPEHVPAYYLRVNDLLTLTFIASRQKQPERYRIGVGDRLRVESRFDESIDREVQVQPDGGISLPLIGEVPAAGRTIEELRDELTERYGTIEREPLITVTAVEVNIALQEIIKAVTSQSRSSGQALDLRVTPEGTIQAPGLGSVYVQGLTLEELRSELEARYTAMYGPGLIVSPALTARATSYVFVGGEVTSPGRYTLEGPTTVMQAIALAGGWNNGGNLRQVVVFRRDENWCLKATKIDIHHPLYGKDPCPVNDVWLRDNDLVVVPKTKILCAADVIELYFTRGIYAVFPITFVKDLSRGSTLAVPIGP